MKGTIASPLPNTNAPASAKNQVMRTSALEPAIPLRPVRSQLAGPSAKAASQTLGISGRIRAEARAGRLRASTTTIPESRNSHAISLSVQPVTTALVANTAHRSRSALSVRRTSL